MPFAAPQFRRKRKRQFEPWGQVIAAVQWDGSRDRRIALTQFCNRLVQKTKSNTRLTVRVKAQGAHGAGEAVDLQEGDWVIKRVDGDFEVLPNEEFSRFYCAEEGKK